MKTKFRQIIRAFFIIAAVFITCTLVLSFYLMIQSPGKPKPFLDEKGNLLEGSISEKTFVNINGVRQGMFIMGKNINNPVLLYMHGGPAFPNYFLIEKYRPGLEEYFTVCYWEQRGGGLSYDPDLPPESMNFEQLASDAIEVTRYLCKRFGKEKIYLMAHSGGTPFAIMAAARAPQLYHAYIGMAQITNQSESERKAYKYMMDEYLKCNDKKGVAGLKKYPVLESDRYIIPFYKSPLRDKSMHQFGIGTMRNMKSILKGVFIPVWMCKAYTLREKIHVWISKFSYIKKTRLFDELFAANIPESIPVLEIPVYFFSGKYDLTVNHDLSKSYLEKLNAPVKGFYTFEQSAHSPIYEEPEKVKEILIKDVMNGTVTLADQL